MRKTIFAVVALILTLAAVGGSRKKGKPSWEDVARQRKTEYIFHEAQNAGLEERNKDSYALMRYASELSPEDLDVANQMAYFNLLLMGDDSLTVQQSVDMMRDYFMAHPNDMYSGLRYARFAERFGRNKESIEAFRMLHEGNPTYTVLTQYYAEALAATNDTASHAHALRLYDSLEVAEGASPELTMARISIYNSKNDTLAIVKEARRFRDKSPDMVENNILLARVFNAIEKPDSALHYYNLACEADTSSAVAAYARAMFYNYLGDSVAYDREIFRVLKMEDLDVDTKTEVMRTYVGSLYADTLQRPRILDLVATMVELHPHEPEFRKFHASYLAALDRLDEAKEEQRIALELDPSDVKAWEMLVAMEAMSDTIGSEAPIKVVNKALEYFPDNPALHTNKYYNLVAAGRVDEGLRELEIADSLMDDNFPNYELRSNVKLALGDVMQNRDSLDLAISYYDEALRINPYNGMALNNYAYMLAQNDRDLPRARRMIETALEDEISAGEAVSWLDTYAWVLFKLGDYEKAKEIMNRCLELNKQIDEPDSAEVLGHAADIYEALGLVVEAEDFRKRAESAEAEE